MFLSNALSRPERSVLERAIGHSVNRASGENSENKPRGEKAFYYGAKPEALLIAALLRRLSHGEAYHG